ncbi:acylneuraminate cytidylyltransferase family protein [Alphaproteobacteria bacterium]|nr:acylneuraminate cytidylyltransferase family protein [Alphaproteobacteria bacterium]
MKDNILFIIPARKNSIRFPGKNLFKIDGKSLLQHKIENCRKSGIGKILITSDDEEVLRQAKIYKVDFIRDRPNTLKGDGPTTPIVYDAVKYYEKITGKKLDAIILTQLTTPFILSSHFIAAINCFIKNNNLNSLISCYLYDNKYFWSLYEDKKQKSYIFPEEIKEKLSNFAKNKKAYIPNGGIYIIKREFIKKTGTIYSEPFKIWEMDRAHSIDIDYIEDGMLARIMVDNLPQ